MSYNGFHALLIGLLFTTFSCGSEDNVRVSLTRTLDADLLEIGNEYSIVILRPEYMRDLLGAEWEMDDLFYGYNRGINQEYIPSSVRSALLPLARGRPVLVFSGTEWPDLLCSVYSTRSGEEVILSIDLELGKIKVVERVRRNVDTAEVGPDGRLRFKKE